MRKIGIASIILLGLCHFSTGAQTVQNFITVYNQDLALVKQVRVVTINPQSPIIRFQDVAEKIIPTSVHLRSLTEPKSFVVLEQNYEFDLVNARKILEKYLDRPIELITETGELFSGKLLSFREKQLVLQVKGGIRIIPWNDHLQVSVQELPEDFITRPTLVWRISGARKREQKLEVSYLTTGMNWKAEYVGELSEKDDRLHIGAWVNITNQSGTTFENARLKLVAGDVRRVRPQRIIRERPIEAFSAKTAVPEQFREKAFFEYHLYTLQRPTTLKRNQIKQISLFSPVTVACTKKFVYNGRRGGEKVDVRIVFQNNKENGLGIPLPKGIFRLYKRDGNSLEFIGEDRIDHTPRNEKVELTIGQAFDIRVKRTVVEEKRISRTTIERQVEVEIRNQKEKEDIDVAVVEYMGRFWEILKSTHPYVQKSANECEFMVPVKANSTTKLKFRVRISW